MLIQPHVHITLLFTADQDTFPQPRDARGKGSGSHELRHVPGLILRPPSVYAAVRPLDLRETVSSENAQKRELQETDLEGDVFRQRVAAHTRRIQVLALREQLSKGPSVSSTCVYIYIGHTPSR
jgi:hypothetical protein